VEVHDEASEVRVDHRALAPGRGPLTGARAVSSPPQRRADTSQPIGTRTMQGTHPHTAPRAGRATLQDKPARHLSPAQIPTVVATPARQPNPAQVRTVVDPPRVPTPARQPAPIQARALTETPAPPARSANMRVTTAQHSSLIGGRYQIVNRIGQGGMGKVYEVNHLHLSR